MIIEALIDVLVGIINTILKPLSLINFTIPDIVVTNFVEIMRLVCYILPMSALMPIIFTFAALMSFRIIVSIIKTIWQLLPLL